MNNQLKQDPGTFVPLCEVWQGELGTPIAHQLIFCGHVLAEQLEIEAAAVHVEGRFDLERIPTVPEPPEDHIPGLAQYILGTYDLRHTYGHFYEPEDDYDTELFEECDKSEGEPITILEDSR